MCLLAGVLAIGLRLGHPWFGVCLGMGLMFACVRWMLMGWVSPWPALLTTVLSILSCRLGGGGTGKAIKYANALYEDKFFALQRRQYSVQVFFGKKKVVVSIVKCYSDEHACPVQGTRFLDTAYFIR